MDHSDLLTFKDGSSDFEKPLSLLASDILLAENMVTQHGALTITFYSSDTLRVNVEARNTRGVFDLAAERVIPCATLGQWVTLCLVLWRLIRLNTSVVMSRRS